MADAAALHRHHDDRGDSLTAAARTTLEEKGEQWTPMRASVFEVLARFEKPASAYDIAEAVSQEVGRRVAANSVYRILDLFVAADLARRVESANAYVANTHPGCLHDCIFLVCDRCGEARHLDADEVTSMVRAVAGERGFVARQPIVEVRGLCADCAAAD
ncbi:Fur family transcriptional regulator [Sphingomonas sp. Y38-1Y]|uniref:Fur family transcriptional regulator n=1 Tax=Sphingomonas sp. Y38-1Y TaxID=3078265 RepID=UPI0028E50998|nr:transcriptional repressor [Sphingomonas sp. Y38-1Y]